MVPRGHTYKPKPNNAKPTRYRKFLSLKTYCFLFFGINTYLAPIYTASRTPMENRIITAGTVEDETMINNKNRIPSI